MKAYDFDAVVYAGDVLCVDCLPEGVNVEDDDVMPIFADAELEEPPVCMACGEMHTYMALPPHWECNEAMQYVADREEEGEEEEGDLP